MVRAFLRRHRRAFCRATGAHVFRRKHRHRRIVVLRSQREKKNGKGMQKWGWFGDSDAGCWSLLLARCGTADTSRRHCDDTIFMTSFGFRAIIAPAMDGRFMNSISIHWLARRSNIHHRTEGHIRTSNTGPREKERTK